MIICIDGPAGAGKSTAARSLAARLGFVFLDTGAMYRAVALAALRAESDLEDFQQVAAIAQDVRIELRDDRVLLDGEDVTREIRTPQITAITHYAADNPQVRQRLVQLQHEFAQGKNVVTEGRDQGTVVFPDAECKIFLTASPEERARRRCEDFSRRGEVVDFDEVLEQQVQRDQRDTTRDTGPLRQAEDAVVVSTDGLSAEEVAERLEELARRRMAETL